MILLNRVSARRHPMDAAAVVGERAFIIEIVTTMIGQCDEFGVDFDQRPNGTSPGCQHRTGGGFEHQIKMWIGNALVAQDDVSEG